MTKAILSTLLLIATPGLAQAPSFEVASVKQNNSGLANGGIGPRGDRLVATNVPLKSLLMYAYQPPSGPLYSSQIVGGPDWINSDRFDIEAKPPGDGPVRPNQEIREMLQSLLKERFQLKAHMENRELPVYDLVLFKKGPKLSADQTPPDPRKGFISFTSPGETAPPLPRGAMRIVSGPSGRTLTGTAISIAQLVTLLQGSSDRVIFDRTGFTGLMDLQLEYSPDLPLPGADPTSPSLFTAIEDLGLKLQPAKAPLPVLVIDSVRKPSEN